MRASEKKKKERKKENVSTWKPAEGNMSLSVDSEGL